MLLRGSGRRAFTATTVPGSWKGFDLLAGAGDLTGDGRDDVVARDRKGRLWLFEATAKGLGKRSAVTGTWGRYDAVLGGGDVDGDGRDDLLVRRAKTGEVFLRPGLGRGTLGPALGPVTRLKGVDQLSAAPVGSGDGVDLLARSGGRLVRHDDLGTPETSAPVETDLDLTGATAVLNAGDFDRDGLGDVVVRDAAGTLTLRPGLAAAGTARRSRSAPASAASRRSWRSRPHGRRPARPGRHPGRRHADHLARCGPRDARRGPGSGGRPGPWRPPAPPCRPTTSWCRSATATATASPTCWRAAPARASCSCSRAGAAASARRAWSPGGRGSSTWPAEEPAGLAGQPRGKRSVTRSATAVASSRPGSAWATRTSEPPRASGSTQVAIPGGEAGFATVRRRPPSVTTSPAAAAPTARRASHPAVELDRRVVAPGRVEGEEGIGLRPHLDPEVVHPGGHGLGEADAERQQGAASTTSSARRAQVASASGPQTTASGSSLSLTTSPAVHAAARTTGPSQCGGRSTRSRWPRSSPSSSTSRLATLATQFAQVVRDSDPLAGGVVVEGDQGLPGPVGQQAAITSAKVVTPPPR